MPPKTAPTDMLHRIVALLEVLADSLANEAERRVDILVALKGIAAAVETLPQAVADELSSETLDRLRHVRYWVAQLEAREQTGPHALPPPPAAPPAKHDDDTRPVPFSVEVRGRWDWNAIKPKLWKVIGYVLFGGGAAALSHIDKILRWLAHAAQ